MKNKIWKLSIIAVIWGCLHLPNVTYALDWEFQPRVETGIMLYSVEIDAQSKTVPVMVGETSGYNLAKQEIEFSDNMSFTRFGATLFANRLFVDLSLQRAFDGNDDAQISLSEYDEDIGGGMAVFTSAVYEYRGHFDRMDWAVSMGYAVTPRFSVFAGYKWAQTDMETRFNGSFSLLNIDNYIAIGSITGEEVLKFKYEGPFVGVTHGWATDRSAFMPGLFSVNLGIASLKSKFSQDQKGIWRIETVNGQDLDAPLEFVTGGKDDDIDGDSIGVTLGFSWRGEMWIKKLSYNIAMSGYRYQFNSDDSDYSDVNETAVTFKFGIAYAF